MPIYYTYILKSEKTGRLYIGQTSDLEDRLARHNGGRNKSTKAGIPWQLLYAVQFATRSEAMELERKLKKWKSSLRVREWISRQDG